MIEYLSPLEQAIIDQIIPESTHLYVDLEHYEKIQESAFVRNSLCLIYPIVVSGWESYLFLNFKAFGDLQIQLRTNFMTGFLVSPTIFEVKE
ncbi:MAG: hypothetical protein WA125_06330 [Desulfosporosinus sp.]